MPGSGKGALSCLSAEQKDDAAADKSFVVAYFIAKNWRIFQSIFAAALQKIWVRRRKQQSAPKRRKCKNSIRQQHGEVLRCLPMKKEKEKQYV